ncbi:MAG: class I SAM-dependent methyltransferase [Herpetosiphonaceae bacterium]|nr:class I SAM-dependent methyltransferase [Herpetosiphonaceae bacterium]
MIYSDYAAVYDQTGQIRHSILTANYLPDLLRRHSVDGRRLLDLACGTGTFAIIQAEAAWQVIGLDRSPAMLAVAERKAARAGVAVEWIEGDLRAVMLPAPVDLATCWYDSLNYLLREEEVELAFRSIYAALAPNGLLCCDVATEYFLRNYWSGVEVYEDADYIQVMQSAYDGNDCSTLVLTGWHRRSVDHWERFREVHVERGYPRSFWLESLLVAGFVVEGCYDCFTLQAPNERSLRLCWVARKPAR